MNDAAPGPPAAIPVLASTSAYRAALLARLGLTVETAAPCVDETPRDEEVPAALAARLAEAKAHAVAARFPERWVLGSDQVCACDGHLLGKPGSLEAARAQLRLLSARRAEFHTAVVLMRLEPARALRAADLTVVHLRALDGAEIERYLAAEPALDCAGGFKCEGLGIALCERIETTDPSALIGLPLMAVRRLLTAAGLPLP